MHDFVNEGSFSVVNVGNNGNVSDGLHVLIFAAQK
jgi:hypothetical protein